MNYLRIVLHLLKYSKFNPFYTKKEYLAEIPIAEIAIDEMELQEFFKSMEYRLQKEIEVSQDSDIKQKKIEELNLLIRLKRVINNKSGNTPVFKPGDDSPNLISSIQ